MGRDERVAIIRDMEAREGSRVLTYICSDRQGAMASIGEDAVRPMFDHLRAMGSVSRIDLFLYSRRGAVDVPWRVVSMIREYCEEFRVLVPFRAHSAATLIALGADQIVIGPKGELGPIDPILNRMIPGQEGTVVQEAINVEDIMGYLQFVRERGNLSDQEAVSRVVSILAEKMGPVLLGSAFRTSSHIRSVARKLLSAHKKPVDEQTASLLIETLTERIYAHGHAIGRREAKEIGLPIEYASDDLAEMMWGLLVEYEQHLKLLDPIDPEAFLGSAQIREEPISIACIESTWGLHEFHGDLVVQELRNLPPGLTLNLNLQLQLPPNLNPQRLPSQGHAILQQVLQQVQQQVPGVVQQALRDVAPVSGYQTRIRGGAWRKTA